MRLQLFCPDVMIQPPIHSLYWPRNILAVYCQSWVNLLNIYSAIAALPSEKGGCSCIVKRQWLSRKPRNGRGQWEMVRPSVRANVPFSLPLRDYCPLSVVYSVSTPRGWVGWRGRRENCAGIRSKLRGKLYCEKKLHKGRTLAKKSKNLPWIPRPERPASQTDTEILLDKLFGAAPLLLPFHSLLPSC